MNLVNATALIVFVALITGALAVGSAYARRPSRVRLHSNTLALNGVAALASIVFVVTFPEMPWGWKVVTVAGTIAVAYLNIDVLNTIRTQYEADQRNSFAEATVEEDRTNR